MHKVLLASFCFTLTWLQASTQEAKPTGWFSIGDQQKKILYITEIQTIDTKVNGQVTWSKGHYKAGFMKEQGIISDRYLCCLQLEFLPYKFEDMYRRQWAEQKERFRKSGYTVVVIPLPTPVQVPPSKGQSVSSQ